MLNLKPSDSRFTYYINEAQQRLITRGEWWGLSARYQICTDQNCLTWPRQFASIEAMWTCAGPVVLRNQWFEFLEYGPGVQGGHCGCDLTSYDRGRAVTFADIVPTGKKLRVYCDSIADVGKVLLVQGYDDNGNWIIESPTYNGFRIVLSMPYTDSTYFVSSITGVQKDETNANVRVYEWNVAANTQRAIAIYEPDETRPEYRRSLVHGLAAGSTGDSDCQKSVVVVQAKLAFIPAKRDTDYLLIGNIPALKDMCQSIKKAENNLGEEALFWEQKAINELQRELNHYTGDGERIAVNMQGGAMFGSGSVENFL